MRSTTAKTASPVTRALRMAAASAVVVALTYSLGRLVVYLYVFDPFLSSGTPSRVPSPWEAAAFGELVGRWVMPASFFVLTLSTALALARAGTVFRLRGGALFGIAAALLHQIAGLYFGPFGPAEAATFVALGVAGGLVGALVGKRALDSREALHEASRAMAEARDPQAVVCAIGRHLAGPGVVAIVLYGRRFRGGEQKDDGVLFPLATWQAAPRPAADGRVEGVLRDAALRVDNDRPRRLRARDLAVPRRETWRVTGVGTVLLVPLAAPTGTRTGVLAIASRRGRRVPRDEARVYATAGNQAALALENLRLMDEHSLAGRRRGVLEERQRLAREIHDTIAQGLTSVVTNLEAAEAALTRDPSAVDRHHREIGRAARGSLEESRRLVWALGPAPLESRTMPEAIGEVIRDFSEESGIPATFSVSDDPDGTSGALPSAAEAALLRVSQEALANVRKHARARRVALTLSWLGDVVALDVRDDGVGFDPRTLPTDGLPGGGGFGLRAMRGRVGSFGGSLTIESAPGEGTAVVAELPLGTHPDDNGEGSGVS